MSFLSYVLMQYAGFENGEFFAKLCCDGEIVEKSALEISEMLKGARYYEK